MAGTKTEQTFSINEDQQQWLESIVAKHKIKDTGKAVRIVLDYAMKEADEQTLFTKVRCVRCGS